MLLKMLGYKLTILKPYKSTDKNKCISKEHDPCCHELFYDKRSMPLNNIIIALYN